jgi:hypothetical protein
MIYEFRVGFGLVVKLALMQAFSLPTENVIALF